MKYEQKGTLAYYEAIPHLKQLSLADVPVPNTTLSYQGYKEKAGDVLPDTEAVKFYALNHLAALIKGKFTKNESLPEWADKIMNAYTRQLSLQGARMFYYMLIICTRETRHGSGDVTAHTSLKFKNFHGSIKGKGSSQAADYFVKNTPNMMLGDYTKWMMEAFDNLNFSSGYGGKKWGEIARTLHRFVKGEITMEMLVDTAYTLSHNNGPIFNKGFLYVHYTDEINKILDIQRSGQVLEYVMDRTDSLAASSIVPDDLHSIVKGYHDMFPDEFGTYVDYFKVEALGALKKYKAEKEKQTKKHGKPGQAPVGESLGWYDVDLKNSVQIIKPIRKSTKQTAKA
jgi:hypothetical protein